MKLPDVFKITEEPKQLPDSYEPGDYLIELVRLVREGDQAKAAVGSQIAALRSSEEKTMIQVADFMFELGRMVHRFSKQIDNPALVTAASQFLSLGDKLTSLLQTAAVTWEDPVGRTLDDELLSSVIIHGWLPFDGPDERVHETLQPIVRRNGEVMRPGRVIGLSQNVGEPKGKEDE